MNKKAEKVVVVTGGAQGIGKAITQHLLKSEYRVVIADIDAEAGTECMEELTGSTPMTFIETDVGSESSVRACIEKTVKHCGRIDALINNAGIAKAEGDPVETLTLADWNRVISTNLTGCFLTSKYAVPFLRRSSGSIVNIASTRAMQSEANTFAYSASKGGLVALTHALAISLGPDIRVNCISPGWIAASEWRKSARRRSPDFDPVDHEQHPVGRVGTPMDIAAMVWFLLTEKAGFITGQNFVIDGGMTKKMIYAE